MNRKTVLNLILRFKSAIRRSVHDGVFADCESSRSRHRRPLYKVEVVAVETVIHPFPPILVIAALPSPAQTAFPVWSRSLS